MISAAVAPRTRAMYDTAVRSYREWCESEEETPDALSITTQSVADWVSDLCVGQRQLQFATISAYKSGLKAWWIECTRGQAPYCPFKNEWLERVMQGVQRTCDRRTAAQRTTRPITPALTPELLERLAPVLRGDTTPEGRMLWAACLLGVHAVLRVGELFGDRSKVVGGGRTALQRDQICFYDNERSRARVSPWAGDGGSIMPGYLEVVLGATKTDAAGRLAPKVCAHRQTVNAVWRWACERLQIAEISCFFFSTLRGPKREIGVLRASTVLRALEHAHEAQQLGTARFTGKCFRRGLTSELMARGAPAADVQLLGGWKSAGMPAVYTSSEARFQRTVAVSRGSDAPLHHQAAAGHDAQ